MRRLVALALLLGLLLSGVSRSEPVAEVPRPGEGDPVQGARCVEVVRSFVEATYNRRFADAFRLVRGLKDPEVASSRFTEFVLDARATFGFKVLSECRDNLFALAGALENHPGGLPSSLEDLARAGGAFPQGLPTCPARGTYHYRREGADYRVWCGRDAHAMMGIRGDYPAFTRREGLTLGNQDLALHVPMRFEAEDCQVELEDYDEQFEVFSVLQTERSRLEPGQPLKERRSRFVLSRQGGDWRIDLALSNRDMAFVFDPDSWSEAATLARQLLFYAQLAESADYQSPDIESRDLLEVRICEVNLRTLSLGIERWSADHHGAYPGTGWRGFGPEYLSAMPRCPAGGTYRFRLEPPGSYRIWCSGRAHAKAGLRADLPALTPSLGVTRGE